MQDVQWSLTLLDFPEGVRAWAAWNGAKEANAASECLEHGPVESMCDLHTVKTIPCQHSRIDDAIRMTIHTSPVPRSCAYDGLRSDAG